MRNPKVCDNITRACNQKCKMCPRECSAKDLTPEEAMVVVNNIAKGTDSLTFSGGECLLYPEIEMLLKEARDLGLKTGIITNGIALTTEKQAQVLPFCDQITFSLDSCNDVLNEKLGRGFDQYFRVEELLHRMKESYPEITVKINTVVTRINLSAMAEMAYYIESNPRIKRWKIFMFSDLRGRAIVNRELLRITEEEFSCVKDIVRMIVTRSDLEYKFVDNRQMEEDYLIVRPDGVLVKTRNKKDIVLGSLLTNDLPTLLECC